MADALNLDPAAVAREAVAAAYASHSSGRTVTIAAIRAGNCDGLLTVRSAILGAKAMREAVAAEVAALRDALHDIGTDEGEHGDDGDIDRVIRMQDRARAALAGKAPPVFNLVTHLRRQRAFSAHTFGPGPRSAGVLDHIRKELIEIEASPADLGEWVDVILLALDGAWRAGHEPEAIAAAIEAKQARNESREWPDWRTVPDGRAIEHVRGPEGGAS